MNDDEKTILKIPFKVAQQYNKWNISIGALKDINKNIHTSTERLTSQATKKRLEAVAESLSWKTGPSQEQRIITELYHIYEYTVAIGKPGKEAVPEYKGCRNYITNEKTNNPNDMNPMLLKNGEKFIKDMTFEDMFEKIEELMHSDLFGLELMGMLLFRCAFMLDHKKDEKGKWRYVPPENIIKHIEKRIPFISEMPVRVFIHFLEILSLNEDIKMYTLGYEELKQDYGRINTLLTFVHLIAVFLNRRSIARFAGAFARPPSGMAPIPKIKGLYDTFPLLSPELFNNIYEF